MHYTLTVTYGIKIICYSMKLNVYIFISTSISILAYYINNNNIILCRKDKTKDLGVIFNANLCWDQHHRTIISRVYRWLYLHSNPMLLPLKGFYIFSKHPTNISLSTLETSLTQRHHSTRKSPTPCHKICF